MLWEYVGYFASTLLVASLMMENVVRLRCLNLAGCLVFTVYGITIAAYPVAFTNALLSLVNSYHLIKLAKNKKFERNQA